MCSSLYRIPAAGHDLRTRPERAVCRIVRCACQVMGSMSVFINGRDEAGSWVSAKALKTGSLVSHSGQRSSQVERFYPCGKIVVRPWLLAPRLHVPQYPSTFAVLDMNVHSHEAAVHLGSSTIRWSRRSFRVGRERAAGQGPVSQSARSVTASRPPPLAPVHGTDTCMPLASFWSPPLLCGVAVCDVHMVKITELPGKSQTHRWTVPCAFGLLLARAFHTADMQIPSVASQGAAGHGSREFHNSVRRCRSSGVGRCGANDGGSGSLVPAMWRG
jgi:hypothetical protein